MFDFRYKTGLSHQREEYLLNYLETQSVTGVMQTKALFDAIMAITVPGVFAQKAVNDVEAYIQLALPSIEQTSKIDTKAIDKKELKGIKALLDRQKSKRVAKPEK